MFWLVMLCCFKRCVVVLFLYLVLVECVHVASPVRGILLLFYLCVFHIYQVCVCTSDGGLIFIYCFVTYVTSPCVPVCVVGSGFYSMSPTFVGGRAVWVILF